MLVSHHLSFSVPLCEFITCWISSHNILSGPTHLVAPSSSPSFHFVWLPPFPYFSHTVPSFNFCHFHLFSLLFGSFHLSSFLRFILFITFHSAQQSVIPVVNVRGDHAKGQRVCLLGGRYHAWLTAVLMEPQFQTHFLTLLLSAGSCLFVLDGYLKNDNSVKIVLKNYWELL